MIKLSTLFWLILVSATGFAMFAVKYEVQALADQLVQTTNRAAEAEHQVRVLDAEWAYLNRPDALAEMNQRYLNLAPIATKQLYASVADIPLRPAPPPQVETVAAVAPAVNQTLRPAGGGTRSPPNQPIEEGPPVQSAEPVRPAPVRVAFRPRPSHRAQSLDALIAQIAESR